MCGICGIIGIGSRETSEPVARRMMDAMRHRGPDEEGFLFAPPVTLGMRRLSIIDLSGGSQPVWNENQTLAVVFNGEIYNFRQLRKELEGAGHQFQTRSDTEVIVHAYEAWGEDCIKRLHGMFAFALVELPQGPSGPASRVFLGRDPLGIKPLYYASAGGNLFFASEVRALLASGSLPQELSEEAVPAYLLFGSVCEPLTLIDRVRSLLPGSFISIPAGSPVQEANPRTYWDAARAGLSNNDIPTERSTSPAVQVRALLESAVTSHLIADVPVGVFLSSGFDSTAIAALASQVDSGIHTFTVVFPDEAFSEAEIARRTANRLGTKHDELMLSDQEMVSRLGEAISALDQPSMDGINTYFVSWAARQAGLKVALSGLGSDELFGGYDSFRATSTAARAGELGSHLPSPVRTLAAGALTQMASLGVSPDRFRKASAAFRDPGLLPHPYFFTRLLFTPQAVSPHSSRNGNQWEHAAWWTWLENSGREAGAMDSFTGISWLELRSYLLNTLLRDTDAVSMRSSLEVRVPFLDTPLVEYVLRLPGTAKLGAHPKHLLISALRDILPEEILTQKKRTFTFPWENWLRGALGKQVAADLANWSPALEPHLSAEFASAVWRDFLAGRTTWSRPWSLYVLNEWAKQNLSAAQAGSPTLQKPAAVPPALSTGSWIAASNQR
jgi:asparagine synthase (glutamine-hydrolysing)